MKLTNNKMKTYDVNELIQSEFDCQYSDYEKAIVETTKSKLINVTPQQIKIFYDCAKILTRPLKSNNPIAIPAKCGIGKSTLEMTFILETIKAVQNELIEESYLPMIIATNRIEDLVKVANDVSKYCGNYYNNIPYVYVYTSWHIGIDCPYGIKSYEDSQRYCNEENCPDFAEQKCKLGRQYEEQQYSPILAITNSQLSIILNHKSAKDGINRFSTFVDKNGNNSKRQLLLIDEKPELICSYKFSIKSFCILRGKIDDIITTSKRENAEKQYLDAEMTRIFATIDKIKQSDNKVDYVYLNFKGFRNKFKNLCRKYLGLSEMKTIDSIDNFMQNGGLICEKGERGYFINSQPNRFNIGSMIKTVIFDGTATISPEYECQNGNFKFLNIDDHRNFSNLEVNIILINCSKSAILEHPELINALCKWLERILTVPAFVISYQSCGYGKYSVDVNQRLTENLRDNTNVVFEQKDSKRFVEYFGNVKGKNLFCLCTQMVQAGHVRYRSDDYIAQFLSVSQTFRQGLINLYNNGNYEKINELLHCNNDGAFTFHSLDNFRKRSMYAELEQNIYRTKIRSFNDRTPVQVNLFATDIELIDLLKKRFTNSTIREIVIPKEFVDAEFVAKKCYKHFAQDLLDYIDSIFNGKSDCEIKLPVAEIKLRFPIDNRKWHYLINDEKTFMRCLECRGLWQDKDPKSRLLFLTNALAKQNIVAIS